MHTDKDIQTARLIYTLPDMRKLTDSYPNCRHVLTDRPICTLKTDIHADTDRHTGRQIHILTNIHTDRQIYILTNMHTDRQIYILTNMHTGRYSFRQICTLTDRYTF